MKKRAYPNRYFFTATEDSSEWLERECALLGLQPPEFIRMQLHLRYLESLKQNKKSK